MAGRYSESESLLGRVLRTDPGNRRAGFIKTQLALQPELGIALALGRDGRLADERQVLLDLIRRLPREPEVYLRLATNAAARHRDRAAAGYARNAAELAPGDPEALFRAAWLARRGDPGAARVYLERVKHLAARSGSEFALYREVPYLEGLLADHEGRETESLVFLQRAFDLDAANVGVAGTLASAYIRQGRVGDARDALAVGLEHHPEDEGLHALRELVGFGAS
jgi:predicted Zn-dependent protease